MRHLQLALFGKSRFPRSAFNVQLRGSKMKRDLMIELNARKTAFRRENFTFDNARRIALFLKVDASLRRRIARSALGPLKLHGIGFLVFFQTQDNPHNGYFFIILPLTLIFTEFRSRRISRDVCELDCSPRTVRFYSVA